MELKSIANMLWHAVIVNGWSVAWRVALLSLVFGALGLVLLGICYKVFYRSERLKLTLKYDRFFGLLVMGLWTICLPLLSVAIGALTGGWWAGDFLIKSEHLGERVGKAAFKTVAAGVAAAHFEENKSDQIKFAHALIAGEEKLSIDQLHKFSSHHAGELSAAQLESIIPISNDGAIHHTTVWAVEKTLDAIAYIELGSEGDLVYKLATSVAAHDRATDKDGMVTVEEVSHVACEVFLDKSVHKLWLALMLEIILPCLLVLIAIVFVPPLLAFVTRRFLAWRRAEKTAD